MSLEHDEVIERADIANHQLAELSDKMSKLFVLTERKLEWMGNKLNEIEMRQCKQQIQEHDVFRLIVLEL